MFFLGICALIATAIVSICQVYKYNEQRKTAEMRMDELRRQLDGVEHKANAKIMSAEAEWRIKLKDEKRDFEKKLRDAEFRRIAEVRQFEKDLKDREKLILSLQTQMSKLSNSAAIVIANLRQAKSRQRIAAARQAMQQPVVVDRTCEKCQGRGKHKVKEQCSTCNGKGFHTVTGTKLRKE